MSPIAEQTGNRLLARALGLACRERHDLADSDHHVLTVPVRIVHPQLPPDPGHAARDAPGAVELLRAEVEALPPGHPYLRLPLQFATALEGLLRKFVDAGELAELLEEAEAELADSDPRP